MWCSLVGKRTYPANNQLFPDFLCYWLWQNVNQIDYRSHICSQGTDICLEITRSPFNNLPTMNSCPFSVAAPHLWNHLPYEVRPHLQLTFSNPYWRHIFFHSSYNIVLRHEHSCWMVQYKSNDHWLIDCSSVLQHRVWTQLDTLLDFNLLLWCFQASSANDVLPESIIGREKVINTYTFH